MQLVANDQRNTRSNTTVISSELGKNSAFFAICGGETSLLAKGRLLVIAGARTAARGRGEGLGTKQVAKRGEGAVLPLPFLPWGRLQLGQVLDPNSPPPQSRSRFHSVSSSSEEGA